MLVRFVCLTVRWYCYVRSLSIATPLFASRFITIIAGAGLVARLLPGCWFGRLVCPLLLPGLVITSAIQVAGCSSTYCWRLLLLASLFVSDGSPVCWYNHIYRPLRLLSGYAVIGLPLYNSSRAVGDIILRRRLALWLSRRWARYWLERQALVIAVQRLWRCSSFTPVYGNGYTSSAGVITSGLAFSSIAHHITVHYSLIRLVGCSLAGTVTRWFMVHTTETRCWPPVLQAPG